MPTEKKLTGYPSIDKPWLKWYNEEDKKSYIRDCIESQNKVLFDLDGTLTRSHYGIFNCFRYALKKIGRTDEPT